MLLFQMEYHDGAVASESPQPCPAYVYRVDIYWKAPSG